VGENDGANGGLDTRYFKNTDYDTPTGSALDDSILGESGTDHLTGGAGDALMIGGVGVDTYGVRGQGVTGLSTTERRSPACPPTTTSLRIFGYRPARSPSLEKRRPVDAERGFSEFRSTVIVPVSASSSRLPGISSLHKASPYVEHVTKVENGEMYKG